jgi:uncharacterized protein
MVQDELFLKYNLRPLSLDQRLHFQKAFQSIKKPISDYTFAYTYLWMNSYRLLWTNLYEHLCIFMIEGAFLHMYMPPIPYPDATVDMMKKSLKECLHIMDHFNSLTGNPLGGIIQYVSEDSLKEMIECRLEGLEYEPSPFGGDYIYETKKIIELSGNSLSSKRYARNKFIRNYPAFRTEPISLKHTQGCLDLLKFWDTNGKHAQQDKFDHYRNLECMSCEMAIQHWQDLELTGMVLIVEEEIMGFTFGERLTSSQFSILIEKTHPDIYGSSTTIFSEFCRQYWSNYAECNAGDDGNLPNLRFTKQEYRPLFLLSKWIVKHNVSFV